MGTRVCPRVLSLCHLRTVACPCVTWTAPGDVSLIPWSPCQVYVTNPDGSPAPRVTVKADGFQGIVSTQRDGTAKLVLNMPANKDTVPITVSDNRHRGGQGGDRGDLGVGVAETTEVAEMSR